MVGGFVQSAVGCRIQIQGVEPAVVGLIRVVAQAHRQTWSLLRPVFLLPFSPLRAGRMAHKQIYYSDKYFDEHYEYR